VSNLHSVKCSEIIKSSFSSPPTLNRISSLLNKQREEILPPPPPILNKERSLNSLLSASSPNSHSVLSTQIPVFLQKRVCIPKASYSFSGLLRNKDEKLCEGRDSILASPSFVNKIATKEKRKSQIDYVSLLKQAKEKTNLEFIQNWEGNQEENLKETQLKIT